MTPKMRKTGTLSVKGYEIKYVVINHNHIKTSYSMHISVPVLIAILLKYTAD